MSGLMRWLLPVAMSVLSAETALAAAPQDHRSINQQTRRALFRGHSCARLAELDDKGIQALVNFAASGEEWYCRLEQTALCRDYEALVLPHARLKPGPGGYLCKLKT